MKNPVESQTFMKLINFFNYLKNDEVSGKLVTVIIIAFAIISIINQYNKQVEIEKNKGITTGKIIDFIHEGRLDYGIIYEYYVNDKRYTNQIGVSFFKCENGKKGCVGEQFTVYYSKKKPKISRINLEEYDKFQKKIEFLEL